MEYIRKKIERKINYLENSGQQSDLKIYYQVRLEYILIYCLAYLWNKNIKKLKDEDKDYILSKIYHPTIGDIEDIVRKLDIDGDFFKNKKIHETTSRYPRIRNEKIGHGYVFEDGTQEYLKIFKDLYEILINSNIPILSDNFDLVFVTGKDNSFYKGTSYKPDGSEYVPWHCSIDAYELEPNSLYLLDNSQNYFRLSPFIEINGEDDFFIFSSIQEPLLGKIKYNKILATGTTTKEWNDFFDAEINNSGLKRRSPNGTILNIFKHNYTKYIDVGIKKKVLDFLLKTSHSVSATVWGHGGVGKTAAIQNVCEELSIRRDKKFDYIIFLSAKDRSYNYKTGIIQEISDYVTTTEEIIRSINKLIFNNEKSDSTEIENFEGLLLIVIDDYETFPDEEKKNITQFIRRLNPYHHRVIVTTRADFKLGDEIQTNELDEAETKEFFLKVLDNEFSQLPVNNWKNKISENCNSKKLFLITNGRPLFIFQFAHTLIQTGNIEEALAVDIKDSASAIDFLYGRIYNYLTKTAQDIFVSISLLVTVNDLSNLVSKLLFILNLENEEDKFNSAIQELVKLRIIEIKENDFFKVYSKEIFQKMGDYFAKREDNFIKICKQRIIQVSKDKKLDNEQALLQNADTNRLTKNEEEVISSYRFILNRATAPQQIKLQAALNLSSYLFTDRGKKESAVKILDENYHLFASDGKFIKMLATYNWSLGSNSNKGKAIKLLLEYYTLNPNLNIDINLELLGLLITYRSIFAITEKDELKESFKYNEITQMEFSKKNEALKEEFHNIWKHQGHFFWDFLKKANIQKLSSGARQNAVTGLYQFSETQIRINKLETAKEICEFVLNKFPSNFHPIFLSKLNKLNSYLNQRKF
jgi:signal recognition particle subunit SEC65